MFVQKIRPLLLDSDIFTRLFLVACAATLDFLLCCRVYPRTWTVAIVPTKRAFLVADVVLPSFVSG